MKQQSQVLSRRRMIALGAAALSVLAAACGQEPTPTAAPPAKPTEAPKPAAAPTTAPAAAATKPAASPTAIAAAKPAAAGAPVRVWFVAPSTRDRT